METCQTSSLRPWLGSQAKAMCVGTGRGRKGRGDALGVSVIICSQRKHAMNSAVTARPRGTEASLCLLAETSPSLLDLSLSHPVPLFSLL